jgi:hypothetical protein
LLFPVYLTIIWTLIPFKTRSVARLHLFAAGCVLLLLLHWRMGAEFTKRKTFWKRPRNREPENVSPLRQIELPELVRRNKRMNANPIIKREARVRWRGARAFFW